MRSVSLLPMLPLAEDDTCAAICLAAVQGCGPGVSGLAVASGRGVQPDARTGLLLHPRPLAEARRVLATHLASMRG